MSEVIVPILCALLPLLLGGVAAYVSRWRCRATALDELTILSRIDPESVEAGYVREILSRRLRTWWQKETAGTGTHAVVTLICVSVLYLLAVAGWIGHHLLRSHELDLAVATRAGDLAAASQAELVIIELVAAGDVLAILAGIVVGLGTCHALLWLARQLLAKKRWARTPYCVPGPGLLRDDQTRGGDDSTGRSSPPRIVLPGTATPLVGRPARR